MLTPKLFTVFATILAVANASALIPRWDSKTAIHPDVDPMAAFDADPSNVVFIGKDIANGTALYWFGRKNPVNDALTGDLQGSLPRHVVPPEELDCGRQSNEVRCSVDHVPVDRVCDALLDRIQNKDEVIDNSRRDVCYTPRGSKRCCISWDDNVGALQTNKLYAAARKTYDYCLGGGEHPYGQRSGRAWKVKLQGTCTNLCVSDRPDGCNEDDGWGHVYQKRGY